MSKEALTIVAATTVVAFLALAGAAPSWGQSPAGEELLRYEHRLRFKSAADAVEIVRPLLSRRGSVEVTEGGATLVIVDSLAAQTRILPALSSFDRPKIPVELQIRLARARLQDDQGQIEGEEAEIDLAHRLRRFLPYSDYRLVAQSRVVAQEGEAVSVDLGERFRVEFRLGNVLGGKRLRLQGFRVLRRSSEPEDPLVQAHLNLWLGRPMVVGLASSPESKKALLVIVECQTGAGEKDGASLDSGEGPQVEAAVAGGGN